MKKVKSECHSQRFSLQAISNVRLLRLANKIEILTQHTGHDHRDERAHNQIASHDAHTANTDLV